MSRLERDTRLTGGAGAYQANLHSDWQIWFPNGGYMGAMLLRAMGDATEFDRPLTMTCYFMSVPEIGEVAIRVDSVKKTRNAEALSFSMVQHDKPIITGMAWAGRAVDGYTHDDSPCPVVTGKDDLKSTRDIRGGHAPQAFWDQFEQRPVSQDLHWQQDQSGPAVQRDWLAFHGDDAADDAFVSAGRYVVLLDSFGWPAAARAHSGDGRYIAPTLSLTIDFHRASKERWMLSEATSPVAENGYMQVRSRLWAESGGLLASAQAMLMCRPRPGYSE